MLPTTKFSNIFGDTHFPFLQSFSVKNMEIDPEHLLTFLLRHKATLTQLRLCNLHIQGRPSMDWQTWFTAMGGQLPLLENVCLRGGFVWEYFVTHACGRARGPANCRYLSNCTGTRFSREMEKFMIDGEGAAPHPDAYYDDEVTRNYWPSVEEASNGESFDMGDD